jgi:Flp pilus assembly pilin Flp
MEARGENGPLRWTQKQLRSDTEDTMDLIRKFYVKINESKRGQTMTEYALILAAVAVVAYAGYKTMGTQINTMLTSIDNSL